MTSTGLAVAATSALLVVCGAVFGYPEIVLPGVAGLVAVVVALVMGLLGDVLRVERVIDAARVVEGDMASVRMTIVNTSGHRSLPALVHQALAGAVTAVAVPALASGARWEVVVELPVPSRGRHTLSPPFVGCGDPLGLVRGRPTGRPVVVVAHPRTCALAPLSGSAAADLDGRTSPYAAEGGGAFHSLRDYRAGDDPRLIHWPSTARTGELVVRHFVVPDETHHLVVLDTEGSAYPDDDAFDDAVRFAASWCVASARAGCPVTLATTSGRIAEVRGTERAGSDARAALDFLADLRRGGRGDRGLALLPSLAAARRRAPVGVVTGRASAADVATLSPVAATVASFNLVCIDPASPGAVRGVRVAAGADLERAADAWNAAV